MSIKHNIMTIQQLIKESHSIAKEKGWWEEDRNTPELLALIHSEISEALEEYRNNKQPFCCYENNGKPEGFFVELADAMIRIADLCGRYGVDMEAILRDKLNYNKTRSRRHGGKRA